MKESKKDKISQQLDEIQGMLGKVLDIVSGKPTAQTQSQPPSPGTGGDREDEDDGDG